MPGKNPAEAISAYLEPLQQSFSCFGKAVLRTDGYDPEIFHTVTLSVPAVELLTRHDEILYISFVQNFTVEKRVLVGWKVITKAYVYSLEDDRGREIIAFHWHPDTTPENPILFPHVHISAGAGNPLREDVERIHFRTDRIAFEEFGLMLIDEFGVVPDREFARRILQENLERFVKHRSWASFQHQFG